MSQIFCKLTDKKVKMFNVFLPPTISLSLRCVNLFGFGKFPIVYIAALYAGVKIMDFASWPNELMCYTTP